MIDGSTYLSSRILCPVKYIFRPSTIIVQIRTNLYGWMVVPSTHQILNSMFATDVSHIWRNVFLVGGDVPVGSKASVVTSSISRLDPSAQSLGGSHKDRMCVSVCACI